MKIKRCFFKTSLYFLPQARLREYGTGNPSPTSKIIHSLLEGTETLPYKLEQANVGNFCKDIEISLAAGASPHPTVQSDTYRGMTPSVFRFADKYVESPCMIFPMV